jgi:hypothetical protein
MTQLNQRIKVAAMQRLVYGLARGEGNEKFSNAFEVMMSYQAIDHGELW